MKFYVKNVHTTLRVVLTILNVLGFWNNPYLGYKKLLFHCYTACWFMYINGSFIITEVGDLIQNVGDVSLMTDTATLLFTNAALSVKMVQILMMRPLVKNMVNECNMILVAQTTMKSKQIVTSCDKETRRFMYIFYAAGVGSALLFAVNTKRYEMPVRAWVPWDISTPPAYEITSGAQIVALFVAAFCNLGIDFLMITLTAQCKCRLELLCSALSESCDDMVPSVNQSFTKSQEEIIKRRLSNCIREHQAVLSCAKLIQRCFKASIFAQFTVTSAILCMTLYQMVFEKNGPLEIFGMFIYLSAIMLQVFFYCYYGNEFFIQSLKVADACYQFPWYHCSSRVRKLQVMIMLRAEHAAYISAGGLFDLSLANFLAIVKTGYSFFTVLTRVAETNQK